jgi:hypothetical protein
MIYPPFDRLACLYPTHCEGDAVHRQEETIVATPIASIPVRWPRLSLAETVASDHVSAACYRRAEDIDVLPVVIAELEFSDVQRQIFLTDLVVGADNAALEDAPEALKSGITALAMTWRKSLTPPAYSPPA